MRHTKFQHHRTFGTKDDFKGEAPPGGSLLPSSLKIML